MDPAAQAVHRAKTPGRNMGHAMRIGSVILSQTSNNSPAPPVAEVHCQVLYLVQPTAIARMKKFACPSLEPAHQCAIRKRNTPRSSPTRMDVLKCFKTMAVVTNFKTTPSATGMAVTAANQPVLTASANAAPTATTAWIPMPSKP